MEAAAAISRETGMPKGRPFERGKSGNPSGRPKGIASLVRDLTSADERVRVLLDIADDPKQKASDRIRATELLLAYGYGKPAATVAPEGYDPLETDAMVQEARAIADELAAKRNGPVGPSAVPDLVNV